MSRTAHPRPQAQRDAQANIRNAAASLADTVKRMEQAQGRLKRALDAGRQQGLGTMDLRRAVQAAANGRPDRARALLIIVGEHPDQDPRA